MSLCKLAIASVYRCIDGWGAPSGRPRRRGDGNVCFGRTAIYADAEKNERGEATEEAGGGDDSAMN